MKKYLTVKVYGVFRVSVTNRDVGVTPFVTFRFNCELQKGKLMDRKKYNFAVEFKLIASLQP